MLNFIPILDQDIYPLESRDIAHGRTAEAHPGISTKSSAVAYIFSFSFSTPKIISESLSTYLRSPKLILLTLPCQQCLESLFLSPSSKALATSSSLSRRVRTQPLPISTRKSSFHSLLRSPSSNVVFSIRTNTTDSPTYFTSGFYKIEAGPARPAFYTFEETKYVLNGQIDILDEATGITHHLVPGDFAFFNVNTKVQVRRIPSSYLGS